MVKVKLALRWDTFFSRIIILKTLTINKKFEYYILILKFVKSEHGTLIGPWCIN